MAEWAQEVLALARRWFIMLRRERLNLVFSLVQPAIWLVFFGLGMGRAIDARAIGAANYLSFVLPGIIAFTVVGNGVSSAMPLLFDRKHPQQADLVERQTNGELTRTQRWSMIRATSRPIAIVNSDHR